MFVDYVVHVTFVVTPVTFVFAIAIYVVDLLGNSGYVVDSR